MPCCPLAAGLDAPVLAFLEIDTGAAAAGAQEHYEPA